MRCSMQEIFDTHFDSYAQQRKLHPRESRAAWCIRNCYTAGCGSHTLRCPAGHFSIEQFHACSHRSCPRCSQRSRAAWVDAELERLLPCPHFHVVFTLPHELLPLWEFNREPLIKLLLDCVRSTLLQLLADPRHLGATPGLLLALHTWGRNLSHHPHVHALVSAGGLTPERRWKSTRQGFLLPLKPLQRLFCGKLLAGLQDLLACAQLRLPPLQPRPHWSALLQALYRKHWNVQINPPYASGRSVALYLARYVRGGPLPKQRALLCTPSCVSFAYTDHRDGLSKRLRLDPHEFIARVLWHAPPKGVHSVRHAGLYGSAAAQHHLAAKVALHLHPTSPAVPPHVTPEPPAPPHSVQLCPTCRSPLWRSFRSPAIPGYLGTNQIPLYQSAPPRADIAHPGPTHCCPRPA